MKSLYSIYDSILIDELKPALGCTEPIAIALAAATARKTLGAMPDSVTVACSGNIVKNVKGVTVPNSGGMKGIETERAELMLRASHCRMKNRSCFVVICSPCQTQQKSERKSRKSADA